MGLRHGQLQHIRRLDIRRLLEHGHQLREVIEPGEPGLGAVAASLRGQLDGRHRLTESRCPGIEVDKAVALQCAVLQVLLHGVHLHHRIGDGGAGGEDHAPAAGQLVQILTLHKQVTGLLGFRLADAAHIAHLGKSRQVFVVMGLVHEDAVDAQLLEGHKVILPGLVVELLQLLLHGLFGSLHLLHRELAAPVLLQLCNAADDLIQLFFKNKPLPVYRHGDFLELAVADDDGIIVAGGDPGAEPFTVPGFKVPLGGHQNVGTGVQL